MTDNPLRLVLIPLDERPVNTRYPAMIARMAGAELLLPPTEIRGWMRDSADIEALDRWLKDVAPTCRAALVSCDFLGYGNLINARISKDSAAEIIARLSVLVDLPIPVHAFSLITRVSNADDNVEEPLYWKQWGTKFYRYSTLAHRRMAGGPVADEEPAEIEYLDAILPEEEKADWLVRRLRNHTVNLALIDLAAHDKLASLLLTSDDTAAWGLPSRERAWLRSWTELIAGLENKVEMHPGADEVGSALVSRLINRNLGKCPNVWIDYAIEADQELIAPYEDRPIRETIHGQIHACGGEIAAERASADIVLGILTPSPQRKDYRPEYLESDRQTRTLPYTDLIQRLAQAQSVGIPVILADVAYPNGADPLAMELLFDANSPLALGELAGYGAWNTAGNTLGVAIAQGFVSQFAGSDSDRLLAKKAFIAHHFLEDWAYQTVVRREARLHSEEHFGIRDPDPSNPDQVAAVAAFIETRLSDLLIGLQSYGVGIGLKLQPGSTRLPWRRTFEVDFELVCGPDSGNTTVRETPYQD